MKRFSMGFYVLCFLSAMSCRQDDLVAFNQSEAAGQLRSIIRTYLVPSEVKGEAEVQNSELKRIVKDIPRVLEKGPKSDDPKNLPKKDPEKPVEESVVEENYIKLSGSVARHRSDFVSERIQFDPNHHSLHVPFKDVDLRFTSLDQQSDIYDALGHDVEVIRSLEVLLKKLDLQKDSDSSRNVDVKLANNLLMLVWQVGHYTRRFMDTYLSTSNLERIKAGKSVGDVIAINALLERFVIEKDRAVKTIQDQITLLASKDKEDMLEGLRRTVGLGDNASKEIQSVSYLIVDLGDQMKKLVQ
ncbi:hypothetical protein [Borrelia hermsii]|uniref:Lipoprotein n=2 Tax=Borrelia hermsii TaxID=140 RepID=T1ECA1_BORHE|nr:hypothetical protein [Borrelia hermsii]ADN26319.2 hypothetical protein BHA058 [Borrelia hermsii]AMR75893.1 hypothetical protein A0V01_04585 [Borrelia hermsii]ANA43699.1 putative lipoprotein [Borrelia hermsii HS1]UCP01924.1 hypothetical protein K9R62_04625 [Borrelia hermsii]UPA08492.1 hypothetical protein bhDAH_001200 [Borrelia hermsii DAH]